MTRHYAIKCPCGHPSCQNWLVQPLAYVQGVGFTEDQAKWVALLLNALEGDSVKDFPDLMSALQKEVERRVASRVSQMATPTSPPSTSQSP